jgi:hypothetical protein
MSEQENNPANTTQAGVAEDPAEASPVPVVPVAPAAPVAEASFGETHTAENTPMKKILPSVSELIRPGTEEDKQLGYLPIFLGNSRDCNERANILLSKWLQTTAMKSLHEQGQASDGMLASTKNEWAQYLEASHADKTAEEMEQICGDLYRFMEEYVDSIKIRSKVMNEDGISNVSDRGSNIVTTDILGKKPSRASKGFSVSEVMRRSSMRAENGEFQFDVLLRDSYCMLTFTRPSKLELAALVNDINRTVKGYVRTVGGNSVTLSVMAGMRVVWDFLAARIVNSSVTGIVDFKDLSQVVRFSDFGTICMALLRSTHSHGVNLQLRCLNDKCDWSDFQVSDPDKLVRVRHSIETPEESAIYANLYNGNAKYTVEQTLEMIEKSTYGLESNRVYNVDKSIYFEVGPSSMAEAFETYDYYAGRINPQLQEIRSKVIDEKEFKTQVALLLTTLGATEFLHWIKTYVSVGAPGTDEEDLVLKRSECEASEFNKGCMDVILDSRELNKTLSAFILNKSPQMAHTFVAVANYHCPVCKKRTEEFQDPDRRFGYTPIDPFMAFFTLTQLKLMTQAAEAAAATKEAISE